MNWRFYAVVAVLICVLHGVKHFLPHGVDEFITAILADFMLAIIAVIGAVLLTDEGKT